MINEPRKVFLSIVIPYFVLYCFFVWRTPGHFFSVFDSSLWIISRIGISLLWLIVLFWRLKLDRPWNPKSFAVGILAGGGWFSMLFVMVVIFSLSSRQQTASQMEFALIGSGIFYGITSGLFCAQLPKAADAIPRGFLFGLFQIIVDLLIAVNFSYVT